MLRRSRIYAPGALHHIIVRGIERKTIFKGDADRDILKRYQNILTERELGMSMGQLSKRLKISQTIASRSANSQGKSCKRKEIKTIEKRIINI